MSERSIFIQALELESAEQRRAYLDEACGGDAALRARVEELLGSHSASGAFLETPAVEEFTTGQYARPLVEGAGSVIGHYKLLQQIGEGGMGVVYMAEQEKPVRRKAALKIIKPGMDSAQVIARFDAERQALSLMDHPNIAKVYDAGTTSTGRLYFVMELVHGKSLTAYCDENNLSIRQRLDLFIPVCQAIQHAHQKGVIHRDIKPGNVLVTMYDGKPVPKVIDFGIAKATEQELTERTLFTRYGVLVGTFEYMAPEQAEMSALGVDTRSDIYSLGVLLYELLTGTTPLPGEKAREAGLAEVLRLIREDEPPTPSTRLTAAGESLSTISARRSSDPGRLTRSVRGELDWIVMKCLEKDRTRRYETADALAQDIRRHLDEEPLSVSPPTFRYRLGKAARRHKGLLAASSAVVAALLLGTALATYGLIRARVDRQAAVDARDLAEKQTALAVTNEQRAKASEAKTWRYYNSARTQADNAEAVSRFLQDMLLSNRQGNARADTTVRELLDRASASIEKDTRNETVQAAMRNALGMAYTSLELFDEAETHLNIALDIRRRRHGEKHPDVAQSLSSLAHWSMGKRDYDTAEKLLRQALEIRRQTLGPEHVAVINNLADLTFVLAQKKDPEAEAMSDQVLALRQKTQGEQTDAVSAAIYYKALALRGKGKLDEAEKLVREAIELKRQKTDASLGLARNLSGLGSILAQKKDWAAAEETYRQVIDMKRKMLGANHPELAQDLAILTTIMAESGKRSETGPLLTERLRLQIATASDAIALRPGDAKLLRSRAYLHGRTSDFASAASDLAAALEADPAEHLLWFECASTYLYLGKEEEYRRYARGMQDRFADSQTPYIAERAAKISLMIPTVSDDDLKVCEQAMSRVLADEGSQGWFRIWYRLTKAILEYRAGRFESALAWTEIPAELGKPHAKQQVTALLFSAMARHRLGFNEQARRDFDEASLILETQFPELGNGDFDSWTEVITLLTHQREAASLLGVPTTRPSR